MVTAAQTLQYNCALCAILLSSQRELSFIADSAAASHLNMLGLSSTSGIDAGSLRKAFLKCAMQWHPDRHAGSERGKMHAEEKFKQIQISYTALQSYLAI